ncbi:MAG: hypothetical protein U9Q73_00315 [Nanoarchaeota archaeon]|nr:hypothetical protein [Nanoarchaeota archaeon]
MSNKFKEKIELAREMFNILENKGIGQAAEIAKRTFCIQDRLAASP